MMQLRRLATLLFAANLFLGGHSTLEAQPVRKLELSQSENAPRAPRDPVGKELTRALRIAKAELEELEVTVDSEQVELLGQIAVTSGELEQLHDEEDELLRKHRELLSGLGKLDEKLFKEEAEHKQAEDAIEATGGEIDAQAIALKERLVTSLVAIEDPERIQTLAELVANEDKPLEERLAELLDVFNKTLIDGTSVSSFSSPLALSGTDGEVEEVQILRLGLLGGYYAHPTTSEAGFVIADPNSADSSFRGQDGGLSNAQRMKIAASVEEPGRSGFLPMDVTGGSGLATLQSRRSVAQWFEVGGVFMWPLLFVAAIALLLTIERAVTLGLLSAGVHRHMNKVHALVSEGQIDDAERLCRTMGGAAGPVLHAALLHVGDDRAIMEDAVQEALLHQAPKFQARLPFIALCAAISPLIGLLGTVTGMILTFKMVTLFGTSDPRFMAGGISEALITTQGGLYVAIPALLSRGVLGSVADRAVGKLESGAMAIVLALLRAQEKEESPLGAEAA